MLQCSQQPKVLVCGSSDERNAGDDSLQHTTSQTSVEVVGHQLVCDRVGIVTQVCLRSLHPVSQVFRRAGAHTVVAVVVP